MAAGEHLTDIRAGFDAIPVLISGEFQTDDGACDIERGASNATPRASRLAATDAHYFAVSLPKRFADWDWAVRKPGQKIVVPIDHSAHSLSLLRNDIGMNKAWRAPLDKLWISSMLVSNGSCADIKPPCGFPGVNTSL
jgi:hypothetical protein